MGSESYENFLIAPKEKPKLLSGRSADKGFPNPDYALESLRERLKNTGAWVPPQFKSEGRGSSIGVGTEEREQGHTEAPRGVSLLSEVTRVKDIQLLDDIATWQTRVLCSLGARWQFKKAHCSARVMLF